MKGPTKPRRRLVAFAIAAISTAAVFAVPAGSASAYESFDICIGTDYVWHDHGGGYWVVLRDARLCGGGGHGGFNVYYDY